MLQDVLDLRRVHTHTLSHNAPRHHVLDAINICLGVLSTAGQPQALSAHRRHLVTQSLSTALS